jgi:hypothetical protein
VDPLGGAGVHYRERIAERYGLNLMAVKEPVDSTFRFMTVVIGQFFWDFAKYVKVSGKSIGLVFHRGG